MKRLKFAAHSLVIAFFVTVISVAFGNKVCAAAAPYVGAIPDSYAYAQSVKVDVIATGASNMFDNSSPAAVGGGSCQDVTGTVAAPDAGKTWLLTKTGTSSQWNGWEGAYSQFQGAAGDSFVIAGYYKSSNDAGMDSLDCGVFSTLDWSHQYGVNVNASNVSILPDSKWRFFFKLVTLKEPITGSIAGNEPSWNYSSQAGNLYINGIHWMKIPAGQAVSQGLTKKWAYGNQTSGYFSSAGNVFTDNSFTATKNGIYTVYAANSSGNSIATIDVENVDTTPPTGSAALSPSGWTTGNVIVNFTAADSQSGVKSIETPDGVTHTGASVSYTATDDGTYNFIVTDNAGNAATIPITVSNIDRSISVTHPVTAAYTIDPNLGTPFSSEDLTVTNNNPHVKLKVSVQSFQASSSGTLVFHDVLPDKYGDWTALSTAQTKSDIALGIGIKSPATGASTWSQIGRTSPVYAAQISTTTLLGVLNPSASGTLSLTGKCGLAWDRGYTAESSLVFLFECCD